MSTATHEQLTVYQQVLQTRMRACEFFLNLDDASQSMSMTPSDVMMSVQGGMMPSQPRMMSQPQMISSMMVPPQQRAQQPAQQPAQQQAQRPAQQPIQAQESAQQPAQPPLSQPQEPAQEDMVCRECNHRRRQEPARELLRPQVATTSGGLIPKSCPAKRSNSNRVTQSENGDVYPRSNRVRQGDGDGSTVRNQRGHDGDDVLARGSLAILDD